MIISISMIIFRLFIYKNRTFLNSIIKVLFSLKCVCLFKFLLSILLLTNSNNSFMKKSFTLLITFSLALFVQFSFAQEKTITGTVTSVEDGLPLPGVNIIVKGTTRGVQTDFDGVYSIQASTGETLIFSYVGMLSPEFLIGTSNTINVSMSLDNLLEEVVVIAFGEKTRDQLTSAVSVVTGEDLSKLSPSTSIDNMLQGIAPGVQVTAANGKPGQTAFVRIRGIGSINAGSAPLYIIDGIVAPDMSSVNPNDIESLSVLKDAATSSLYGSRAANGVIVIKTKTGRKNKAAVIQLTSRYGIGQKIEDNFRMMNAAQKIQYERELNSLGVPNAAALPGSTITSQADYDFLVSLDNDWQDTLLRQSVIQSNALSITGGSEDLSYFLSVGHDRNTGIIKDVSGFERLNGRLNLTFNAKEWLEIGANVSISSTSTDEPRDRNNVQNPFRAMYDYQPYEGVYEVDDNGNTLFDSNGDPVYNLTGNGFSISEALINNPEDQYNTYLIGGLFAKIDLTEHLTNEFRIGASNTRYRREYFLKPGSVLDGYVGDADNPGSKTDNGANTLDYTVTNLLSYNRTIADKHEFTLTGLFEFNKNTFRNYSLTSSGYGSTGGILSVQSVGTLPTATSTDLIESTLLSYGGFLDYNYENKYLMTASVRRDASSTFGINNRYGVFWSASAGWNITKESFMENGFFDELKIRGSAGTSGNRSGIGSYQSLALIGFGSLGGNSTAIPTDNGNPNLGFEKNFIWDAGIEFTILDRKLRGVIDYYERTTSDLLLNVDLLRLGGEPDGVILSNVGEMVNKGIEVELSADIFKTEDFQLTVGGNIAFVDNEVTKLEPSIEFPEGAPIDRSLSTIRVGEEINTYYMPLWAGVNPANGQPLFYDSDGNITNVYDSDANVVLTGKSPLAKFDGGANLYVNYKGFDLGMDFYYKFGHYIYNFMESNMLSDGQGINANQRVDAFNYWRNPGDVNVLPSPLYGNDAQQFTDRFLQKGDYVRLRNLTLGYNLPRRFAEVRKHFIFKNLYSRPKSLDMG